MNRFLATVRFLTILPVPGSWGTGEADLAGSLPFFPIVGLLLGLLSSICAWALMAVFSPAVTSALLVVLLIAFSGGLHMDGLSDSADGMLSARSGERILEIMKDSHIGAMGVIAIVAVMLVKFATLASLSRTDLVRAAFLIPVAGRCAMVLQITLLPYVRAQGLGSVFTRSKSYPAAIWAGVVILCTGWLVAGSIGLLIGCLSFATTGILAFLFYRKIGGATGDTYGATCEIAELAPALVLAAFSLGVNR